jgi:hypothetical protein
MHDQAPSSAIQISRQNYGGQTVRAPLAEATADEIALTQY